MRLGISMGDPSGIGPEVVIGALRAPLPGVVPIVFGSRYVLERADARLADASHGERLSGRFRSGWRDAKEGDIGVCEVADDLDVSDLPFGRADERSARIQLRAFQAAMGAAEGGDIDAIVTAPWTKSLLQLIDHPPVGHTELLAERFDAPEHVMMLAGDRLRVALVTVHIPLRDVADAVTPERLSATIRTTVAELRSKFGVQHPGVAVLGLNPHAGESGTMGLEDRDVIAPTIVAMAEELGERATLSGPHSADTFFGAFRDAQPYDAVVCQYHDQGLIPLKTLHFGRSANITLGLPIIRTSVDHGTAWDIAGTGQADPSSMRYALELAAEMVERRS